MPKAEIEDYDLPGNGDENVGEGVPPRKREKRRKSKEERAAERRVVFWTLLIILIITLGFWLLPNLGNIFRMLPVPKETEEKKVIERDGGKGGGKNYVEITL